MFFEDARDLTLPAVRLLESQKTSLGCPDLRVCSLVEFNELARAHTLSRNEKEIITDQAILLIDQFYAHLTFKRARYAGDPVQSLRLIRAQLDDLSDAAFHDQMIQALVGLRDAHTFYALPDPYQGAFAFLPFQMECFYERVGKHKPPKRKYIVTHIIEGFQHHLFTPEAEITSWNGVPTEQAVEREGQSDPGGNPSSRFARSINNMCARPLALSLPPPESFVVIGYKAARGGAEEYGIVMPWYIGITGLLARKQRGTRSSINESMAQVTEARKLLFRRQEIIDETAARNPQTKYPQVFSFQYSGGAAEPNGVDPAALCDPAHPDKKFGYIRIKAFELDAPNESAADKFVEEFQRIIGIMQEMAPDGLVLDIRSNPGGAIEAAERILQFLTPKNIEPAYFHFACTATTQRIAMLLKRDGAQGTAAANQQWLPWVDDLSNSVTSGKLITAGRPLTDPDDANDEGQIYQGPVTLLIDALAYSAADIFAAGFQDHKIGVIIGVDANTGGGGANRWLHNELLDHLKLHGLHEVPMQKLPRGAELGLAIRRSSRVADNAGNAIEDEGVKADVTYQITRSDLLNNDRDLLAFVCGKLAVQPSYRLKIDKAEITATGINVSVTTRKLFRLECVIDTHFAQCSVPVTEAQQSFQVPVAGLLDPPGRLQIYGFAQTLNAIGMATLEMVVTAHYLFEETAALPAGAAAG